MVKHRSPAYPAINLGEAVNLVEKLYPQATKHPLGANIVAEQWGYKSLASAASYIAALKHFGLLDEKREGEDRMLRLTPLAKDIAVDREGGSQERLVALRQAAKQPVIFAEMWEKWGNHLPPEGEIRRYLERERDFNPKHVGRVAANYRDTLEVAKLDGKESLEDEINFLGDAGHEVDTLKNGDVPETSPKGLQVGTLVQWNSQGQHQFPKPLPIARIDMKDGEQFAFFEGKGHAPMSQLTIAEPVTKTPEINLLKPTSRTDPPQQGVAEERITLNEGPVELTMPQKLGRDSAQDFEEWVDDLPSRANRRAGGENRSVPLPSGGTLHLISYPGSDKWQIRSYDFSWFAGFQLMTATVRAAPNGWESIEFDTPEDAVKFVEEKPRPHVVPPNAR